MISYDYNNGTFSGIVVTDVLNNQVNVIFYSGNKNIINDNIEFTSTNLNTKLYQPITGYCMNDKHIYYTYENLYTYVNYTDISFNWTYYYTNNVTPNNTTELQWIYYDERCDLLWATDNSCNYYFANNGKGQLKDQGQITNKQYNYITGAGLLACTKESASGITTTTTTVWAYRVPVKHFNHVWYYNSNTAIAVLAGENAG